MTDILKLFELLIGLKLSKVIFQVARIKYEIVVARNNYFIPYRNILYELSKFLKLLSLAFHSKISSMYQEISWRKRLYINFLVHTMSIRKCYYSEFFRYHILS